jgi:serine/threonine protein kinase
LFAVSDVIYIYLPNRIHSIAEDQGHVLLYMELMAHDMQSYLLRCNTQSFAWPIVRSLMWQLLSAMAHVHQHGIVHGDITREVTLTLCYVFR